jgi:hypothetical protein
VEDWYLDISLSGLFSGTSGFVAVDCRLFSQGTSGTQTCDRILFMAGGVRPEEKYSVV